jgi:ribosome biogenesis protein UTP30
MTVQDQDQLQPIPITREQVEQCLEALKKCVKPQEAAKEALIPDANHLFIVISTKKIPERAAVSPIRIPIPHSYRQSTDQVCLFTKDPQREYKDLLKEKGINDVNKVIGVEKLRKKYQPYEARRILCSSYDLFLVDRRVVPMMSRLLGKTFLQRKKFPVPVNLTSGNLTSELQRAIHSAHMTISTGTCITVRIGDARHQSMDQLADNVIQALPHIVKHVQNEWSNIQSIQLKTTASLSLPIYQDLPKLAGSMPTKEEPVESSSKNDAIQEEKSRPKRVSASQNKSKRVKV